MSRHRIVKLAVDGLALLMAGVASIVFLDLPIELSRGGVIYVSTVGSDWNRGRSAGNAVATIQRAADLVEPGGTVLILPGVYREELRIRRGGRPGLPVTFKASVPGTVTISGEASPEVVAGLDWRNEGDKIWSAETPWPVYHVIGDGENFYHVRWADGAGEQIYHWKGTSGRLRILREIAGRPGARGAFTYESGRLYIAYPDGASPRSHSTAIHRKVPRPYASWSLRAANVWVEESHVRFEDIIFHLGVGSGLLLWNSQDVVVSDCTVAK